MAVNEPKVAKLQWLDDKGTAAWIGGGQVSLRNLRDAVTMVFTEFEKIVNDLTFKTRLPVEQAWKEDRGREDSGNSALGWSAITDRADRLLQEIADRPPLRGQSHVLCFAGCPFLLIFPNLALFFFF